MTVIDHEFGLLQRLIVRRFTQLLDLDALHEANVRANPLPYLERASERIFQLEKAVFDAARAASPADTEPAPVETLLVDKAEYQRLLNCRAIVEHAFAQLGSNADKASALGNP